MAPGQKLPHPYPKSKKMTNSFQSKKVNMKPINTLTGFGLRSLVLVLLYIFVLDKNVSAQTLIANSATDTSVCAGSTSVVYSITPAAGAWTFSLPNGGGAIISSTATSVTINWGTTSGTYYVSATNGVSTLLRRVWIEGDLALACDDLVNVSVDEDCQALITPTVVLEGTKYPDDSYVVTVYNTDGSVVPGNIVTGAHVDKTLRVHVRHICTGITCWGYIKVEDKFLPALECPTSNIRVTCSDAITPDVLGYPLPVGAIVLPKPGDDKCFIVRNFDLCCDVELCYFDIYTKYGCNQPVYAQYVRNWVAKDCKGNTRTCSQTIDVLQGNLAGIVCPQNYDGFTLPYLNCDDKEPAQGPYPAGWNALDNGNPSPYDYRDSRGNLIWSGTGYPLNVNCDHLAVTYRDLKIPICGNSFKIFRNWKIFDWCTGEILECNQLIKVVDNKPPIIACTNNYMVFPMDYYTCTGSAIVSGPELIIDCSATTLEVSYKKAGPDGTPEDGDFRTDGITRLPDGRVKISGLLEDTSWVRYTVMDACGNITICNVEVLIEDNLDPVAVCDQHTVVTLGDSGVAKIFATSLDQGSFDNCTIDSILVRKMTDNCGNPQNTVFGPYVKFCCEDVTASPIMVALRVIDRSGNFNDCMVSVTVQDKIAPDITCPRNISVPCTVDIHDLTIVGRATATDNCGNVEITYTDDSTGFNCATGTIRRRWRAEDPGGRFDLCDQIITIIDPNPLTRNGIFWPALDLTVSGCSPADAHPDVIRSFPTWTPRPCANIIRGFEDERFYDVDGFCVKILRKWRVVDWCQYDVNNPSTSPGVWDTVQVIKVQNSVPPTISASTCAVLEVCAVGAVCEASVPLIGYATDDCTDSTLLKWSFAIDFDNNGSVDVNGNGKDASGTYRVGSHRIRWSVTDRCGNLATCDKIFRVKDCKEPTPFCKVGLITVVMGSTGSISVKAVDFNEKSEDNCTPSNRMRYSFSANVNDTTKTFTCANIPNGVSKDTTVRIYVTDLEGNQAFCTTTLTLQDNAGNSCPNRLNGGTVSGLIAASTNSPLKGTMIELMKSNGKLGEITTLENGQYSFLDLPVGESYDLMPSKNDDAPNGITTADIVMIQRHILGQSQFNSPLQYIAADANNSGSISAADISELRKIILGINTEFRNGQKSWRFVEKNHQFEEPSNPWIGTGWPESMRLDQLSGDVNGLDFTAVKIGDLNLTASTNFGSSTESRTYGVANFELLDEQLVPGSEVLIPVYGNWSNPLVGFQMSLSFDDRNINVTGIQSGSLKLNDANAHISDEGFVNISWNNDKSVESNNGEPLFYLVADVHHPVKASRVIGMNYGAMNSEAYTDNLDLLEVRLKSRVTGEFKDQFELYQNAPNPFSNETTISFFAPQNAEVWLKIRDMSGKLILTKKLNAKYGLNQVVVHASELKEMNGIIFYSLEASSFSATRKMIIAR